MECIVAFPPAAGFDVGTGAIAQLDERPKHVRDVVFVEPTRNNEAKVGILLLDAPQTFGGEWNFHLPSSSSAQVDDGVMDEGAVLPKPQGQRIEILVDLREHAPVELEHDSPFACRRPGFIALKETRVGQAGVEVELEATAARADEFLLFPHFVQELQGIPRTHMHEIESTVDAVEEISPHFLHGIAVGRAIRLACEETEHDAIADVGQACGDTSGICLAVGSGDADVKIFWPHGLLSFLQFNGLEQERP